MILYSISSVTNKQTNKKYLMKKIMLGTSDAWSTTRLSRRPSEPAYYIVDCQIFNAFLCCNNSLFLQMTLPNYCNVQLQAEKQSTIRQATSCQNAERKNSANAFVVVRLLFFDSKKKTERQTTLVVQ